MIPATDEQRARVVPVAVDPLVERPRGPLDPKPAQRPDRPPQVTARPLREDERPGHDRADDEERLDPEVRADRVVADREQRARSPRAGASPPRRSHARARPSRRSASRPRGGAWSSRRSATHRPRRPSAAPARPRRRRSRRGSASATDSQNAARAQQQLPALGLRRNGDDRQHRREQKPAAGSPSRSCRAPGGR